MNKASINGNSIFFLLLVGPETTSLSGTENSVEVGAKLGHSLHWPPPPLCGSLRPGHETGYFLSQSGPQAFTCLLLSWRFSQSTQVLNIHNYESLSLHFIYSSCTCHKFQVTPFPSISYFDDQVVCFIHAVHYCLCVFKKPQYIIHAN